MAKLPSYVELLTKELERPDLTSEQRDKILDKIGQHEQRKHKERMIRARGAKLTPAKKYTPKIVREAIIAEHEERAEAERQAKPLGQRVEEFARELLGEKEKTEGGEVVAVGESSNG